MTMSNPWMERAIQLALENVESGRGGPFGAVVVRGGKIAATGVNMVAAACDPTAHAEVVAIREAAKALGTFDLEECEIYSSCEPCPMCLCAIYWARIGKIYYAARSEDAAAAGFDDSRFYQEISSPPERRAIPMVNLMRYESLAAFEAWRRNPQRVEY